MCSRTGGLQGVELSSQLGFHPLGIRWRWVTHDTSGGLIGPFSVHPTANLSGGSYPRCISSQLCHTDLVCNFFTSTSTKIAILSSNPVKSYSGDTDNCQLKTLGLLCCSETADPRLGRELSRVLLSRRSGLD